MSKSGKEITLCDNCGREAEFLGYIELDRKIKGKNVQVRPTYGGPDLCMDCFGPIIQSSQRVVHVYHPYVFFGIMGGVLVAGVLVKFWL